MIHDDLMEECKEMFPELEWTVLFHTEKDNSGQVFIDNELDPHEYDADIYYPSYGIVIRSSDWSTAESIAYELRSHFHKRLHEVRYGYLYKGEELYKKTAYHMLSLMNRAGVMNLGVDEYGIITFKVILDSRLIKIKEEIPYGTN